MTKTFDGLLAGDYPDSWDEYVGQPRAKRALQVAAHSVWVRGRNLKRGEFINLDHTLIASPHAGIGKTALAQLTARHLGRRVLVVSGSMNLAQARMMFARVKDGDIIFYDEIHKVMDSGKKNAEWLLHYLENGVLVTPFGTERVPKCTIIGATTDKGVLPAPILQRFKVIELVAYSDEEATQIALTLAGKVFAGTGKVNLPLPKRSVAAAIARAANNQPRLMRAILHNVRDLAVGGFIPVPKNGKYDLTEAFEMSGVTADGLTQEAQAYLVAMVKDGRGAPMGQQSLKDTLGLVGQGLKLVEELLKTKGYLLRTPGGRVLTGEGMNRATELMEAAA